MTATAGNVGAMTYAIQAEGLVKRYADTTALAGLDLAARPGTVLAVLGPNGAGKTTAVRVLATLVRPDAGRAHVAGLDVMRHAAQVRRRIGLTGQYASVDEDLTGFENLTLIGQLLDLRRSDAKARAVRLLARFELSDAAHRRAGTYSGGMRRRLDLAASMVSDPEVVFLDEPTTGLDPGRRDDAWRIIRSMTRDGGTVLLTTQYLEEADALADHICVVDAGRVIAEGTPAELKRRVGGQAIAVRPADPQRHGEVAHLLDRVTGTAPEHTSGVLTVPVSDDRTFTAVVQRLDAAGVRVAELSLRLPSLDEVFLTLTGRHTDQPQQEETA